MGAKPNEFGSIFCYFKETLQQNKFLNTKLDYPRH